MHTFLLDSVVKEPRRHSTPLPDTDIYLAKHKLVALVSGLWWFYFTKSLKVQAR